ncbi:hypothetical protein G3580_18125 [Nitrogeniibacter mangrovi]|uniref:Uncharacterized protein n=1 Tax=Nitrogeniibacter mangrovi TaxID=2016596 RepID=A0A6C1B7M0_9RHOO|nr:hypothetical protein [Nitrogeniibacter mangrovi]QID19363.1 hypothetical protein G3580_18125 [Nitrogeniibacter mangrovi]
MTRRIDGYAVYFSRIDRRFCSATELTQETMFDLFGAEGLRKGFNIVTFLCERLAIAWNARVLVDLNERRRLDDLIRQCSDMPWHSELKRYASSLNQSERKLQSKTVRYYVSAAIGLVQLAGVRSFRDIRQAHLDRLLRTRGGLAASLSAFARHLRESYGVALKNKKPPTASVRAKERTLIRRIRVTYKRLEETNNAREARAMLARLLADLYQIPLQEVLALTGRNVRRQEGHIVLWPSTRQVHIDHHKLARHFDRWLPSTAPDVMVFEGRNRVQPLSTDAVRYHTERLHH